VFDTIGVMQYTMDVLLRAQGRGVAQFGSALGSGPRGPGFKSRHLDHFYASTRSRMCESGGTADASDLGSDG
jgi:hypothetical protein